jgi:hypothetical protein
VVVVVFVRFMDTNIFIGSGKVWKVVVACRARRASPYIPPSESMTRVRPATCCGSVRVVYSRSWRVSLSRWLRGLS